MNSEVSNHVSSLTFSLQNNCREGDDGIENDNDNHNDDREENSLNYDDIDEDDTDDETYLKFLKSVLVDDDQLSFGSNSCNDDDEEDFIPEDESDDQSNDGDDDNDDKENFLVKVARKELQELIDGCWQTLATETGTGYDKHDSCKL